MTSHPHQTARQRRNLLMLGIAGGAGIASLVVAIATVLLTGTAAAGQARSTASPANKNVVKVTRVSAACVDTQYKDQGREHTDNINEKIAYNSFPPTSGKHYVEAARWGNYRAQAAQIQLVHNLEHGGIVVQYGDKVSQADHDAIAAWYDKDPNGLLVASLPRLGHRIAATAWTHLMVCQRLDIKALDSFKKKYRYKAPEKLPKEYLEPGR